MFFYIFLFGLLVRLPVGFKFTDVFSSNYATIAWNLIHGAGYSLGGGHPTALRTPGYTLILAGLMALFGKQRTPFIVFFSIVGAINASLCAWLGIKIFNRKVGLAAGLLYVFIPYLAQKEAATPNGLITLGLLAALCLLWKGWQNKSLLYIGLAGLCFAFSYMVSPSIGLIPLFVSICLLLGLRQGKNIRWHLVSAIILMLIFAIGIFPWAARNYKIFKRLYISRSFFWYNVYTGNHARTFEIYPVLSLDNFAYLVPPTNGLKFTNEIEQDLWFRQQAIAEIRRLGLAEIITRCSRKFFYLWSVRIVPYTDRLGNDPHSGRPLDVKRSAIKNLLFSVPYGFILIFTLIGCWQERRRPFLLLFTLGFIFTFSIPYMVTIAYSKYAAQIYFILILLAARGLVYIVKI